MRTLLFTLLSVVLVTHQVSAECREVDSGEAQTRLWNCGDREVKIRNRAEPEILVRLTGAFHGHEFRGEVVSYGNALELQALERSAAGNRPLVIVRARNDAEGFSWEIHDLEYDAKGAIAHILSSQGGDEKESFYEGALKDIPNVLIGTFQLVGSVIRDNPELVYCQLGLCSEP